MRETAEVDWRHNANCKDATEDDRELFFPDGVTKPGNLAYIRKKYCIPCPVREACLQFAFDETAAGRATANWGIWGGMSEEERKKLPDRLRSKIGLARTAFR